MQIFKLTKESEQRHFEILGSGQVKGEKFTLMKSVDSLVFKIENKEGLYGIKISDIANDIININPVEDKHL